MPVNINTHRVMSGSDYDFWKINLPIQEGRSKYSSNSPVNILSQTGNSMLGEFGSGNQSILKGFR